MRSLLFLLACALSAPLASAQQPVSVVGRIEALTNVQPCAPVSSHRIQDTDVLLYSTTVNLTAVPSTTRRFVGIDRSVTCPIIEVLSVENAPFSLFICNTTALGCPVTIDLCPHPTTGSFLVWLSPSTGYAPVSVATGTFLLNPAIFVPVASGANTAVCQSIPLVLAGPASLVGLQLFFQGASLPTTGAPVLSSIAKMTILSPTVPCTNFQCY